MNYSLMGGTSGIEEYPDISDEMSLSLLYFTVCISVNPLGVDGSQRVLGTNMTRALRKLPLGKQDYM